MRYRCLIATLAMSWCAHAAAADGDPAGGPATSSSIFIDVIVAGQTPGAKSGIPELDATKTLPGYPVTIRGITAPALYGRSLSITVTPPQRAAPPDPRTAPEELPDPDCPKVVSLGASKIVAPTTMKAAVDRNGGFEVAYTPTTMGDHEIEVIDDTRRYTGNAAFEVGDPADFLPDRECKKEKVDKSGLEREAEKLTETAVAIVDAVATKINGLPASPAKDEAKIKIAELQGAFKKLVAQGKSPNWVIGAAHLVTLQGVASEMHVATMGLSARLGQWHGVAKRANEQGSRVLADVTRANIFCDQLDVAVNALTAVDFFLGLLTKPATYFKDWAIENVPTKLMTMIPAVKRTKAGTEAIETSWKGITTFAPLRKEMAKKHYSVEFAGGVNQMAYAMSAFMLSRAFDRYCQTFQGAITGEMKAEFRQNRNLYWTYTVTIKGEIILRYPRNATGEHIALTGEIIGNAVSFRSWDNAIPVLFPKLAMGTVLKSIRQDPMGTGDIKLMNDFKISTAKGVDLPNFNPVMSDINQGGVVTRAAFTPNFFRVPVRGDLSESTLRLELQNATMDFDDARTKVIVFMLPVTALMIYRQDYALPFKGARFLMFRAMHDGPADFPVVRSGKVMKITRNFDREKRGDEATGVYKLNISACNPGC